MRDPWETDPQMQANLGAGIKVFGLEQTNLNPQARAIVAGIYGYVHALEQRIIALERGA